jgi:titin
LSWQPPVEDGGSPITGYNVERTTTKATRWLKINKSLITETTYKVDDLIEGTEYRFRVVAENKAGPGPESEPSDDVLAKDPWGKKSNTVCFSKVIVSPDIQIFITFKLSSF